MKLLTVVSFTFFVLAAQVFAIGQEWASRYNGAGNSLDWAYAIALDPAGNVVVTGYSTGAGTGKDYKTIKYNTSGELMWEASFNGSVNGGDYSNALWIDQAGNVYITGRVDYGNSDIVTIKYNSSGVQQWMARYGGPANGLDEGHAIQVDANGNVYIAGKTMTASSSFDIVVIKYDASGNEMWVSSYNGSGNNEDIPTSIALDSGGNIYVAGGIIGSNSGQDFAVLKYNSSGGQQWVKSYNGAGNGGDLAISVKVDASGNIFAGGYTDMGSMQKHNYVVIKYNPSGTQLWETQYNGSSSNTDLATAMTIDANSNVYITGVTTVFVSITADSNYATIKYNSDGQFQWIATYDGLENSFDVSRSIFVDNSSNVYISGSSRGVVADDYVTIKYNSSGQSQWVMRYNGTGNSNDYSSSVTADNEGNVYVTGRSTGQGSSYDYATIKYGDLVGISSYSNEIPAVFRLHQNYPNPFNPSTKIKFDLPSQSNVILSVFNSLGQEVLHSALGELSAATYQYDLNALSLTSGIYYYRITAGHYYATKKMVIVK